VISRRRYLECALPSGVVSIAGHRLGPGGARDPVSVIPFANEGPLPTGVTFGEELDGRRLADLSTIRDSESVTAAENFYIRTRASRLLPRPERWRIQFSGPGRSLYLEAEHLVCHAATFAPCVMECAGNGRAVRFGLMSMARWGGVRLAGVLGDLGLSRPGLWVRVSGFDAYESLSATSIPGASWVFSLDDLRRAEALLATHMNGQPLTLDHGAPVRLVVPGWYGCCSIKWVNRVELVSGDCDATSQMLEYAFRTGQGAQPAQASMYKRAEIESAAVITRVEEWRDADGIKFLVAGIAWGGEWMNRSFRMRLWPAGGTRAIRVWRRWTTSWSHWAQWWRPPGSGEYWIDCYDAGLEGRATRNTSGRYSRSCFIPEA
jgi:DMSO/TMAO reductase YedYZ molybdopterin-dependent catalytic subunit